ncbi:MAG: hypothetical protein ACTSUX_12450 [Promethearchaeota archaeon]
MSLFTIIISMIASILQASIFSSKETFDFTISLIGFVIIVIILTYILVSSKEEEE